MTTHLTAIFFNIVYIATFVLLVAPHNASADMIRLLESPGDAWQARVNLIEQAEETLDIEYHTFANDEISKTFYALILDAADRGVQVRIISDALTHGIPEGTLAYLVSHENIDVRLYQPIRKIYAPTHWNKHLHDKGLLADGDELIAGGRNIHNRFYGVGDVELTRDRDIYIKAEEGSSDSPAAYLKYFNEFWNNYQVGSSNVEIQQSYECPGFILGIPCKQMQRQIARKSDAAQSEITAFYSRVRADEPLRFDNGYDWSSENVVLGAEITFVHDPIGEKSEDSGTSLALRTAFKEAQVYVYGQSPYVVPTKKLMASYIDMHERGVTFTILTNSIYTNPNPLGVSATDHYKSDYLEEAGMKWWEFQDGESSLHQKSFVIDDHLSIVGGFNLDPRSSYTNTETLYFIESEEFALLLKGAMDYHKRDAVELNRDGIPILTDESPPVGIAPLSKRILVSILSFLAPVYRWAV